jgi:hypothetical protein
LVDLGNSQLKQLGFKTPELLQELKCREKGPGSTASIHQRLLDPLSNFGPSDLHDALELCVINSGLGHPCTGIPQAAAVQCALSTAFLGQKQAGRR